MTSRSRGTHATGRDAAGKIKAHGCRFVHADSGMGAKLRRNRVGLLVLGVVVLVFAYAGKCAVRPIADAGAAFADVQRGHLRRLDGASVERRVVFLGGSSFQGLDTASVTPIGLNLSIGGDTLQGMIERSAAYRSLARARVVIVNIGLNDLMRDCAQPAVGIEDLFALVRAETPIILLAVQGVQQAERSPRCDTGIAKLIDEFNQRLLDACNYRDNCHFIPSPVTTNMDQDLMKALQESDGIHFSVSGYQAMSKALRNALSKVDASLATIP